MSVSVALSTWRNNGGTHPDAARDEVAVQRNIQVRYVVVGDTAIPKASSG